MCNIHDTLDLLELLKLHIYSTHVDALRTFHVVGVTLHLRLAY